MRAATKPLLGCEYPIQPSCMLQANRNDILACHGLRIHPHQELPVTSPLSQQGGPPMVAGPASGQEPKSADPICTPGLPREPTKIVLCCCLSYFTYSTSSSAFLPELNPIVTRLIPDKREKFAPF